jgi:Tol biopolymer transport system component
LYWLESLQPGKSGIYATSLDKPNERTFVMPSDSAAQFAMGRLLWRKDAALEAQAFDPASATLSGNSWTVSAQVGLTYFPSRMNFSTSSNGLLMLMTQGARERLAWFDLEGKIQATLAEGRLGGLALSPDGRRGVFARGNEATSGMDLWTFDTGPGVATRLTSLPGTSNTPIWGPDSRTVAFRSGSPLNIFLKDVDANTPERRLYSAPGVQTPLDWSRNGRHLLIAYRRGLWYATFGPDGSVVGEPRVYLQDQFNYAFGQFSPEPDPRHVVYSSDESGRYEIYVREFPQPRAKVRISRDGGTFPAWSADGREIFWISPERMLMSAAVRATGDGFTADAPRKAVELVINPGNRNYAVSPDGRRILAITSVDGGRTPVEIILNWPALAPAEAR